MIFRAATAADLADLAPLVVADPASPLTFAAYLAGIGRGEYRREWTWVARDGDTGGGGGGGAGGAGGAGSEGPVLAAGIWWGRPGDATPGTLDAIYTAGLRSIGLGSIGLERHEERAATGGALIAAAHRAFAAAGGATPDYHVFLPGDWRERRDVVAALSWRWDAALRAGLTDELERLRFEWTRAAGVPRGSGRLVFRADPDDGVFAELFARALEGTLDATSRKTAAAVGAAEQARLDVAFYRDRMWGDRAWWRVAETADGEAVGFGVPSANPEGAVVGYLGVVPEHRGHGYVDDIVAEITRVLVAEADAETIAADTDLANQPMAAAFERAGYRNFARRLVLSHPLSAR